MPQMRQPSDESRRADGGGAIVYQLNKNREACIFAVNSAVGLDG